MNDIFHHDFPIKQSPITAGLKATSQTVFIYNRVSLLILIKDDREQT
jgi:hypothetical protein